MGKKKKQELKTIAIDSDHILYRLASPPANAWKGTLKGRTLSDPSVSIKQLKKSFMAIVDGYVKTAEVESINHDWGIGDTIIVISDKSNFRYDIYPEYKANRGGAERTEHFIKLRKWARKKFAPKKNIEADDYVAWIVRNGGIGFSEDKDLLRGVAGIWFDAYHSRQLWKFTSKEQANEFNFIQYVAGDAGDNIKGIVGVAEKTAIKLLDQYGWTWDGVRQIYIDKGYPVKEAILTRRLVSLNQWSPDGGVKLFKEKK